MQDNLDKLISVSIIALNEHGFNVLKRYLKRKTTDYSCVHILYTAYADLHKERIDLLRKKGYQVISDSSNNFE